MKSIIQQMDDEINKALQDENTRGDLQSEISNKIDWLYRVVKIDHDAPVTGLMNFVKHYVNCVPLYFEAVETLAQETHIDDFVQPFLNLAYTYFINPPKCLATAKGLKTLLLKAYLAHRMLEEVNDQIATLSGAALIPVDISTANLVCVHLIGDEFASQLDHLVLMGMETLAVDRQLFKQMNITGALAQLSLDQWQSVHQRWPVFKQGFGVELLIT
ncbi:MAG: hypothetical protein KTR20_10795 [Cellvibrionaceae bacterium]|nr:hypothetical protein [Cellvibrionaceae bacterium]